MKKGLYPILLTSILVLVLGIILFFPRKKEYRLKGVIAEDAVFHANLIVVDDNLDVLEGVSVILVANQFRIEAQQIRCAGKLSIVGLGVNAQLTCKDGFKGFDLYGRHQDDVRESLQKRGKKSEVFLSLNGVSFSGVNCEAFVQATSNCRVNIMDCCFASCTMNTVITGRWESLSFLNTEIYESTLVSVIDPSERYGEIDVRGMRQNNSVINSFISSTHSRNGGETILIFDSSLSVNSLSLQANNVLIGRHSSISSVTADVASASIGEYGVFSLSDSFLSCKSLSVRSNKANIRNSTLESPILVAKGKENKATTYWSLSTVLLISSEEGVGCIIDHAISLDTSILIPFKNDNLYRGSHISFPVSRLSIMQDILILSEVSVLGKIDMSLKRVFSLRKSHQIAIALLPDNQTGYDGKPIYLDSESLKLANLYAGKLIEFLELGNRGKQVIAMQYKLLNTLNNIHIYVTWPGLHAE